MSYVETVRRVMEGSYGDASPETKRKAVADVTQACSIAAAAVTWQPIPVLDSALIIPIQIALVQAVGRVHGYSLDKKSVVEILSTFGASILAQNVIMAAAKLVPILGWVVSVSMAYALTYAIGEVSQYYFENGRGISSDELRSRFKEVYREKRREKEAEHRSNQTLKDRLEQLNQAKSAGLLSEEEYARKKEEILSSF